MKAVLTLAVLAGLPAIGIAQYDTARPQPDKVPQKSSPPASVQFGGGIILGGSDSCATPAAISGQGVFAYDNTGATTGTEGQAECSGTINNDEWFNWTADATGTAVISTCGQAAYDTELAAYPSGGCPVDGSSLDCNDDACSLQSSVTFPVSNGSTYLIQAGSFSLGSTGVSGLAITIAPPAANDDCTGPTVIAGQGSFAFNTTSATQGTQGQNEGLCVAFGTDDIDADVWFTWTADADGRAVVATCTGATHDTKMAAYPGAGCPVDGTSLACNDDTCSLQSTICFEVTNGGVYTIQLGSYPGAGGGAGTFDISISPPPVGYQYDGGVSNNSFGGPGGGILWGHAFDATGGSDTITQISSTYGTPLFPGLSSGRNARVLLYDDPNDDYEASDAVLLYDSAVVTANEDTDIFNDYAVPSVAVSGVFFVAVVAEYDPGQYPAPMDQQCAAIGRSFFVANSGSFGGYPSFDYTTLTNNELPPTDMGGFGYPTNWLLRAVGNGGIGSKYCIATPNSTGFAADISASGSASSAAGDLTLTSAPVPNQNGIIFHGVNQAQNPFGNGFMCTTGGIVRGAVFMAVGNVATYTYDNSNAKHSMSSFIGTTRNLQHWFRDPMGGGALFNLSNAISIAILP